MATFEDVARALDRLAVPTDDSLLALEWVVDGQLAVARLCGGRYAVVLPGPRLTPTTPRVARITAHDRWTAQSGEVVPANLLEFPASPAYKTAVSAVAAELLRAGLVEEPLPAVFADVEPFIELVLQRGDPNTEWVLGLAGELLVFAELLEVSVELMPPSEVARSWQGWRRTSRDFKLRHLAIEVKTTSNDSRVHKISGFDQVEPSGGSTSESTLFLASLGLQWDPSGLYSIPLLVDRVLAALGRDTPTAMAFLDQLREYGPPRLPGQPAVGYDHHTMSDVAPFSVRLSPILTGLLYDMADPNMRVLRRSDISDLFVEDRGISFHLNLPDSIPGSVGRSPMPLRDGLRFALTRGT